MKCCTCSSNEELPEGTLICLECSNHLIGEGKNYMRGFSNIGNGLATECNRRVVQEILAKSGDFAKLQLYYPSQKEFVEETYDIKLESRDCEVKGIRFIEIPTLKYLEDYPPPPEQMEPMSIKVKNKAEGEWGK